MTAVKMSKDVLIGFKNPAHPIGILADVMPMTGEEEKALSGEKF